MKKQIFLSFRPEYFRPVLYGIKKYEYRKRFCKEAATAFLYLSAPVREVVGIVELGVPIKIENVVAQYPPESIVSQRAKICLDNGNQYAIPIESLQLYKQPVPFEKIKQLVPSFMAPRCYLNADKFEELQSFLLGQEMYDTEFYNSHQSLYEDNFGLTCSEMELTPEFREKDALYVSIPKYNIIKCGYLNKALYPSVR